MLERDSSNLTVRQHTVAVLARPYTDADGTPRSFIVAGTVPGVGNASGSINAYSRIELFGQDFGGLFNLTRGPEFELNAVAGGRLLQVRERLDITGTSRTLPAENVLFGASDHFQTFDKFYGGQLGLQGRYRRGSWSVGGKVTVALGGDDQEIRAKGDRVLQTPTSRVTDDTGLYVLPSNRGTFDRAVLDFVGEARIDMGWEPTSWLRVRAGYGFLYWNNPVRAGDQIGPLNLNQVASRGPFQAGGGAVANPAGPALPGVPFRTDTFRAQGVSVGLEFRW